MTSCVRIVKKELRESLEVWKFWSPALKQEVGTLVAEQLNQGEADTINQLHSFLDAQKSLMNTRHPELGWGGDDGAVSHKRSVECGVDHRWQDYKDLLLSVKSGLHTEIICVDLN